MDNEVVAILDKLQELRNDEASTDEVSYYANVLCKELLKTRKSDDKEYSSRKVSVILPQYIKNVTLAKADSSLPKPAEMAPQEEHYEMSEEEVVSHEEVEVDVEEQEAESAPVEANEVKKIEHREPVAVGAAPETVEENPQTSLWDEKIAEQEKEEVEEDQPTEKQDDTALNETGGGQGKGLSWNEKLKLNHEELGHRLKNSPVKKLSQAIGINDKFTFINELFREDQALYSRCLKTIDKCKNLDEAMYWINRELKIKLGWQDDDKTVQDFYHLVKKRFA